MTALPNQTYMEPETDINLVDYQRIVNSISDNEVNNEVKELMKTTYPITKEHAHAILHSIFEVGLFKLICGVDGYFNIDSINANKTSLIEIHLVNKVALDTILSNSNLEVPITKVERFLLLIWKEIYPSIQLHTVGERMEFYIKELREMALNSTRLPNLILYHIYTNPLLLKSDDQANWSGNPELPLRFMIAHSVRCAYIKSYIKKHIHLIDLINKGEEKLGFHDLEQLLLLLDTKTIEPEYPEEPKFDKDRTPTQLGFLHWSRANHKFHLDQFPYLEKYNKPLYLETIEFNKRLIQVTDSAIWLEMVEDFELSNKIESLERESWFQDDEE